MRRHLFLVVLVGIGLLARATTARQTDPAVQTAGASASTGSFVGADACRDCHPAQFKAWSSTKHANAVAKLSQADRDSGRCIRCHVTGTAESIAAEAGRPSLPNVQCEACHGAGRAHVEAATAGSPAAARTQPISEESCTRCHNETSPHYKAFIFAALKGLVHRTR